MSLNNVMPILVAATGPIVALITGLLGNRLSTKRDKEIYEKQLHDVFEPMKLIVIKASESGLTADKIIDSMKDVAYTNLSLIPPNLEDALERGDVQRAIDIVEAYFNWLRMHLKYPGRPTRTSNKIDSSQRLFGIIDFVFIAIIIGIIIAVVGTISQYLIQDIVYRKVIVSVLSGTYALSFTMLLWRVYKRL